MSLRALIWGGLITAAWTHEARAVVEYDFSLIEAFDVDYDLREVILRDINESGLVTGTATHNSFYDGFSWTLLTDKTILPLTWPQGINNLNQVVSGGTIRDLDTGTSLTASPVGGWPIASLQAINDNGIAVGYSECSCSNSDRTLQAAMVWDADGGSRTIPVANAKELLRINNAGVTVGNIRGGSGGSEGFVYDLISGVYANMTDLLPPYLYGRAWSELQDVSETGVACGRGWDGQNVRGLTWSQATGFTFLPAIPGGLIDRVYPRGINATGIVVGFADLTLHSPRAFIWDPGNGMRNLNDLVVLPPNFILDWAIKINDQGWIIGIGHYGPTWGTSRGFVLKPVSATSGVAAETISSPPRIRLLTSPVTDRLAVQFSLSHAATVRLKVFNLAGRRVATLPDQFLTSGIHDVSWTLPVSLPNSVYFLWVEGAKGTASTRFVLAR